MKQAMSLYYTLSDLHQDATVTLKGEQTSGDNVLEHDVCNFYTLSFSIDKVFTCSCTF